MPLSFENEIGSYFLHCRWIQPKWIDVSNHGQQPCYCQFSPGMGEVPGGCDPSTEPEKYQHSLTFPRAAQRQQESQGYGSAASAAFTSRENSKSRARGEPALQWTEEQGSPVLGYRCPAALGISALHRWEDLMAGLISLCWLASSIATMQ